MHIVIDREMWQDMRCITGMDFDPLHEIADMVLEASKENQMIETTLPREFWEELLRRKINAIT